MKPLLFLLLAHLLVLTVSAQPEPIPFGTISFEEREMTECSFDKEAEAVILFDRASSTHDEQHHLITDRHTRIKVLKTKGIERGEISIYYYHKDDFEFISNIEAAAYTKDAAGNLITYPLKKANIYRQKVNDYYSVVKFALSDVQVGTIIEYKYVSQMKSYGGLEDWYFQWDIPILYSGYSLVILPNSEFAYQVHKSADLPIVVKNDKNDGSIYFEMRDVAALRDEPYSDAEKDYRQHVEFQLAAYGGAFGSKRKYMTTWDEVSRELSGHTDFGVQLNKNVNAAADLVSKAKAAGSPFAGMSLIYRYLSRTIGWNGYKTRFTQTGLKEAWDKQKGSTADINLLLVNLLRQAGLQADPLLVSERSHGKVRPDYPFLDQFNNVMAYVQIGDKAYVLDAAGSYTPPDMIPINVVNTMGYVVNRKKGGIKLLEEKKKMDQQRILVKASVDEEGSLHGYANIKSYDYNRLARMRTLYQGKEEFQKRYITQRHPSMKTDSINVLNQDNDSLSLDQQIYFTLPASSSGDYKLINLNLFTEMESSPFVSDIRFTNIDHGCSEFMELMCSISLPASLEPETVPKDSRMIMPDTSISFSRFYQYNGNVLSALFRVEIKRPVFTAEEYPYIKEFYKKMIAFMNEPFVLRKKQ
ncbi:MAG: DUF3857 domain-containing protein [Candidatus Pseudobacter hemicellulosilyticus]|uniref:DUF3857 domain-containing protein n=1 Tax=Candidatus Pseudobacter hemicellulosilyticus TaxID=3121375 RepID=A0AAJ6BEN8_9BACT|nr:MAG: DUF3857 domain-containing protein [Pseudobacter sp.]